MKYSETCNKKKTIFPCSLCWVYRPHLYTPIRLHVLGNDMWKHINPDYTHCNWRQNGNAKFDRLSPSSITPCVRQFSISSTRALYYFIAIANLMYAVLVTLLYEIRMGIQIVLSNRISRRRMPITANANWKHVCTRFELPN